ncbi:hypothetical protein [Brachybacterium massiliense]|uniref:hypothetical protein n=1 Tax=Brachybacterium massiliense TaxID=1755098 RepID=UPI000B3BB684|nr:hypothetical protein [Brachybacterium massiliense]
MNDLFNIAMAWIQDQGLPEPEGLKLIDAGALHRIELNYLRPVEALPDLGWVPSQHGPHAFAELAVGDVQVSVYAERVAA